MHLNLSKNITQNLLQVPPDAYFPLTKSARRDKARFNCKKADFPYFPYLGYRDHLLFSKISSVILDFVISKCRSIY